MVSIRPATLADAASIARVHVQSWRTTYTGIVPQAYLDGLSEADRAALWQQWLTSDIHTCVAELDGQVVGFASGGPLRESLPNDAATCDAELFAIYLLPTAQRRGIGTALLRALAESLQARGFNTMLAWVLQSNSSSRFYEKTGALPVASKEIEIGGAPLPVLAYRWPDFTTIASAP